MDTDAVLTRESAGRGATGERILHFVTRAMLYLESDRNAARRYLNDASALLGSKAQESRTSVTQAFRPTGLAPWQARRALAHIEASLGSRLLVRELAELVGLSNSHFSRAFTQRCGLPPMTYVMTRRVERAKAMMSSTSEQLKDIALACGFADGHSDLVSEDVRKLTGQAPQSLRDFLLANKAALK